MPSGAAGVARVPAGAVPDCSAMPRRLLLAGAAWSVVGPSWHGRADLRAGYGADNDTWLMLGTWDVLVDQQRYVPSRPPGYLLPELVIGATADVGGHWLSNLVSVVLAAGTLVLVHGLVRRRTGEATTALLLLAVLGCTPAFVIAATTSMDYVYGLFLFVAGWSLLERRGPAWAGGVLLGLAAASRLAYAPLGLVVVLLGPGRTRPARDRGVAVVLLAVVGARVRAGAALRRRPVVPDGRTADGTGSRRRARAGRGEGRRPARPRRHGGRGRGRRAGRPRREGAAAVRVGEWWLLVVAGMQLAVWLWIPAEPSYLLPALVALLVWVARPRPPGRRVRPLGVLAAPLALYAVVDVRLVEVDHENRYGYDTCDPTEATGAASDPTSRGPLLGYPAMSDALRACNERSAPGSASRTTMTECRRRAACGCRPSSACNS